MMVVFFSLGGGVFIVVLLLFLLTGATYELCTSVSQFIENNIVLIGVVLGVVTLLISALSAFIKKRIGYFIAGFITICPLMFGLVKGMYWVTTSYKNSFFLMLFSFAVYAVVYAVECIVATGIYVYSMEESKVWPLLLAGAGGMVFNFTFW